MAAANCGEPLRPRVSVVLKGEVKVSTMDMVLLRVFTVRIAPVSKLNASEVGLTPTGVGSADALSGLYESMALPWLEVM